MNREQLEHVLRAASAITGADRLVVIGSQAILGQYPAAPDELTSSIELDVFTFRSPDDAELIDGTIGEMSPFHQTFGYNPTASARGRRCSQMGGSSALLKFERSPPAAQPAYVWRPTTWPPRSSLRAEKRTSPMSGR